jgi:iron complex transport system substrate-binding protein
LRLYLLDIAYIWTEWIKIYRVFVCVFLVQLLYNGFMNIISLEPFLTELIFSLGLGDHLLGRSSRCDYPEEARDITIVTGPRLELEAAGKIPSRIEGSICSDLFIKEAALGLEPDVIVTQAPVPDDSVSALTEQFSEELSDSTGKKVRVYSYKPYTLDSIYEIIAELGRDLGFIEKGRSLSQNLKAQFMDWSDNFYDRMKNKKVTFLTGIDPYKLGGWWIPDMIKMASAEGQFWSSGKPDQEIAWEAVVEFRPDVILVAPRGMDINATAALFRDLEKCSGWEEIPAVKRGEVYFTDGKSHFFSPTMRLIESMAVLVSAIAGFESGYIAPRDSFYKLRWLELQRHKFL